MKLATYQADGGAKIGVVDVKAGRVFDLAAAAQRADADASPFRSMLSLIDADEAGLDAARALAENRGAESDLWIDLAAANFSRRCRSPVRCATRCLSHFTSGNPGGARAQSRRGAQMAPKRSRLS